MCCCGCKSRKTTPLLQPLWFQLTQTPSVPAHGKSQFISLYKGVFSSAQTPSVTVLYYLYCSLGLLDCVCLLTTSSARLADMLLQLAMKRNKEPFECVSVKTCC